MSMVLMRISDQGFQMMLFRSMARTAWHEVEVALRTLAARAA
jgi:sarcosine oxidase subunit gamma